MSAKRYLIVTADDVGLHRGMNEGAIRAHRQGIVTAASLVANGREFDHAVELLRQNPRLEPGIHLTFVEEKPLTAMSFPKKWPGFLARYTAFDFARLETELRAQVEKILATGLKITHLNSHQHLHALPRVREIVDRLALEHGIGYVRAPRDRGGSRRRVAMAALRGLASGGGNDRTIGIADAGHLTASRIRALLDHVDGVTELVAHPGLGEIASAYDWGYDWNEETAALCDPSVRDAITEKGIKLTTPSAR